MKISFVFVLSFMLCVALLCFAYALLCFYACFSLFAFKAPENKHLLVGDRTDPAEILTVSLASAQPWRCHTRRKRVGCVRVTSHLESQGFATGGVFGFISFFFLIRG